MTPKSPQFVWVGLVIPAPDHPPRPIEVKRVFADEAASIEWQLEGPAPSTNGPYRTVQKHEVVR